LTKVPTLRDGAITEMEQHMHWYPYQKGASLGLVGCEDGVILQDDEHTAGARITLEERIQKPARFAITCGLYGWFFHTRFFASEKDASHDFAEMKLELGRMADLILDNDMCERLRHDLLRAISDFVDHFPT
jgi:hypothetical protein